ncbi:InlB B-repeat-containing protein [Bifidobacterium longum]|uniref:InlB B-repeat-containing protein n=1 Tax=Bifidobacterium longum TaxID=216816 RepID=UPI0032C0C96F
MHSILKRSAALIASAATLLGGGMLMAGTAQADGIGLPVMTIHPAASTSYPKELVNGDFQTFGNRIVDKRSGGWQYLSFVDGNGMAMEGSSDQPWAKVDGWNAVKFGWKSNDSVSGHSGIVEVQRFRTAVKGSTGNVWGEIAAAKRGRYIYQDIATTPGVVYKWSLKHASRNAGQDDSMQVMIGDPGKTVAQQATRTTSNGTDKVGEKSTTITTHGTAQDGRWETYTGDYIATSTTTRFTFRSIRDSNGQGLDFTAEGNCVDDLSFDKAYKLSYDKNSSDATGSVPSNQYGKENTVQPAKSKTTGTVKTVADENVRYGSLANGDFSYPSFSDIQENEQETDADLRTFLKSDDGTLWDNMSATDLSKYGKIGQIPGFDSSRFAWSSTENGSRVELQQDRNTKNTYAEIVAQQDNTSIYQNVSTGNGGVLYKIRLKHASRQSSHADKMQVLVGSDTAHATPVEMSRVTSNGHGDKVGGKSTTITTKVSNTDPRDHGSQWETYEGYYQVPEGQKNTVFMFKSLEGFKEYETLPGNNIGNLVDDIEFSRSYKLTYDKNSSDAAGQVPSNQRGKENTVQPAKSKTAGSVGLAADKTASGLTVHDLKKNDKGKVPSSSKADSTQPAAFKAPDAKVETIASRAAGDELAVNGGFDTPKWSIAKEGQGLPWVYVKPNAGTIRSYAQAMAGQTGVKAGGLTAATFAWQDLDAIGSIQNFELHREKDGNTAADVHAGRTVAQTVNTTPGASYTFSIRHSGRSKGNAGGVTLLTGPDKDHLTPVKLTRTTVSKTGQKYGDKTGDVGTVAYTHSDSMDATEGGHEPWDHSDDWESYEGTVIIPAGQSRTMIAYRGVAKDGALTASANDSIIDDLSFRLAYKLGYGGNGGTGQVPSRTETGRTETAASGTDGTVRLAADKSAGPESGTIADDRRVLTDTIARQDDGTSQRTITRSDGSVRVETIATTGAVSGCQVYYPAGTRITLATAKADSDCWDSSQIGKTNRTFYGWSANTDANDKDVPVADTMDRATLDANAETQITMPARAKTVYALWAINPTLTYNVNAPATTKAPDAPASMTVPYNTAADDKSGWTVGDTGKITGYSFDGWYTSPTGGDKYDWSTKLTNDVTMYAHWTANGYTVKYDAGGGKGTMGDQKFTFDVPQNLSPNAFTRDGYTFTGWKRADTGDSYTDGQQVSNLTSTPNGVVTMVAQWTPNAAAINYNANPPAGRTAGGQGTANWTGHTGDTQAIGANGWTVDGYRFIGWNTSADGKGTAYAPGTTWIANGTLTLYAQWTPGQAGLTYDGNGATGGKTDPQPGKTDEKINVRDNGFTRDGYMFVTWNTQAGCKGKAVNPGDEWTLQGSSTLYACWAGTAQTLAYHGNGATGGNTAVQSGKTGDELTTNANGFTRDGYTFVRWDTAKDGSGTAYGEGKNGVSQYTMKPAGNDLYAIWKANPASIVYRNGYPNTTGSTPDTTGSTGDTVTVSQNGFDRPGYTFTGWSTSKRGDPSLNPGDKHTLEPGTTTVWAQWKANPAHLVYNSNIGSIGSETKTVDGVVDQTVKTLGNPFDRPGYTFSGWNTQADGKGKAYDPGADYTLTANDKSTPKNTSVLYAQWTINKVTLKFDPNGGVGGYPSINTDAFGSVTIPKDAKEPKVTRPGFRFTGWSLKKTPDKDETLLTPGKDTVSMPAEGEVAVYAQWEPSMTTLPFTGGNAQIPTIWLWAGLAFLIIAAGAFSPMIRLRMGAGSKGRHAGTPTIGRHSR